MATKKPAAAGSSQQSTAHQPVRRLRITALDRLIINAVVDSRQGVEGALSNQDMNDAVDEFVRMNGRRQQSYFHAGFRDALFDLPHPTALPAQNEKRARWYWSGAIHGWARSELWDRITDVYDSNSIVRQLGDGADGASRGAGICIAEALWKTGRAAELHVFVDLALARRPNVHELLLEAGTESLRLRNPGVARSIFEVLLESNESRRAGSPRARDVSTVRRRMAHCLRLLGEHRGAEELLRGLLLEDRNPDIHAMVHADLGLLKGRFSLLDEVRIPGDKTARRDIVDRLKAGEEHFQDAVAVADATYASHGHYCLGVLALADDGLQDERFRAADFHLERAHAQIRSNRAYPTSLVAQADLYLGIAKLQLFDVGEIRHAARLIVSGLEGADIPSHFIAPTIDSLALSDESIELVADPLLDLGCDDVLDALAETTIAETYGPLADSLWDRARQPNRRKALGAADLRRALRGYLGIGDVEKAREVLDELERLAVERSGVKEFLQLLDEPERYEPAWEEEDAVVASARCLEVDGRYGEAVARLRGVFHSYMQRGDVQNGAGILDRIHGYGLDDAEYNDLKRRYQSSLPEDEPELPEIQEPVGVKPVTVLVVGGAETQARGASRVKSKVTRRDPHTSIEFLHTGWSSNWKQYADEIDRRLAGFDAVVVMRYIRTNLGTRVRAICRERDVPWRFCWSGGQGGLIESVLAASSAARLRAN